MCRRSRVAARIPARQAASQSTATSCSNARNSHPAPGITSAAISAKTASGRIRGPRRNTAPGRGAHGGDCRACGGAGTGSGRSAMMRRTSPAVFAVSAAAIRSSSSSGESRPSAKCSRSRAAARSRSASEIRIRSSVMLPALLPLDVLLVLAWSAGLPAEDPVHLAPGPPEQLFGFLDLLGRARVGDLHDPAAQPGSLGEQARQLPGLLPGLPLGRRLPGAARRFGVLLHVLASGLGQAVRAPAVRFLAGDQALVGELGQRGIYRAGARPPGPAGALLDLGHDLVAVARAFPQQGQDRGPHVAAAGLRAPRPTGRGTGRSRPPAGPRPAEATAPGPRTLPAPEAPLPRPAARHRPDAAADLAEQVARAPEYPGQAGATITRSPRRRHHPLSARLSRYGHDISAAYR